MPRTGDERSRRELLYQRWTAAQFELAECATPVEIRRKLLEKLTTDDLVLSDECHTALRLATGSSNADSLPYGQADWAEEGRLSTEVENFACEFFSLSPKVREERWQRLRNESTGYAAVKSRLHEFKRGLKIDVAPLATASPDAQTLADGLLRRFCLLAWERAPLRRRELAERAGDFGRWRKAARELFTQFADIAALDPDLIHELTDTITRKAVVRRVATKKKAANSSGGSRTSPWMVVILISAALRFIITFSADRKPTPTVPHIELPKTMGSAIPAGSQLVSGDRRKLYAAYTDALGNTPEMPEVLVLEQQLLKEPTNDELRKQIAEKHLELARAALQRGDPEQVYFRSKSAASYYRELSTKKSADSNLLRNYVTATLYAKLTLVDDDAERQDLLLAAWETSRVLMSRGDATTADQQTADDVLHEMVVQRSNSYPDQTLALAREAAETSRAEWEKDRKRIDLRNRLDARLRIVGRLLLDTKHPDLAHRTASERMKLWAGNPARLRNLAIEFVRTGHNLRAASPKDPVVKRESEEWLARGLTALQQATAAGLKNLKDLDWGEEWSALRTLPAYQKWRNSLSADTMPEKKP